jgi:hypothetical protein
MKSLLSENMLRFGTKNLSATQQKELIVKSIMETIDQHGLRKAIYNRLVEQTAPAEADPAATGKALKVQGIALKIVGMILDATMGTMGVDTDEEQIAKALKMIPQNGGKPVYDAVLKLVQTGAVVKREMGKNYNTVSEMIATEFFRQADTDVNSSQRWMDAYNSILSQYNKNEKAEPSKIPGFGATPR